MGSLFSTCRKSGKTDTARDRRILLNKHTPLLRDPHAFFPIIDSSKVRVTTEYVEKPDGTLSFTKLFEPKDKSKVKGMICYSIGFGNFSEWFPHNVGTKYAEFGFVVFMMDHKGLGRSDGPHCQIYDFDKHLVDEAIWLFDYARNKYIKQDEVYKRVIHQNKNYFLAGHSMGGAISILVALKQQNMNKYKGVISLSPMVAIDADLKPPEWSIWFLKNILLRLVPHLKVLPNGLLDAITKNKELQKRISTNPLANEDPLALITAGNLLYAMEHIQKNAKNLILPILICHGDDDIATDPNESILFYENCKNNKDKTIKIYKGVGHMIFQEEPNVYNDTVRWMTRRIKNDTIKL